MAQLIKVTQTNSATGKETEIALNAQRIVKVYTPKTSGSLIVYNNEGFPAIPGRISAKESYATVTSLMTGFVAGVAKEMDVISTDGIVVDELITISIDEVLMVYPDAQNANLTILITMGAGASLMRHRVNDDLDGVIADFNAASFVSEIQAALDLKANIAGPTFTGTVGGITKTMVGLGNVDNTADSGKPVSTAQQTALDLKTDLAFTINTQADDYELVLTDKNTKLIEMTKGTATTLTIPANGAVAFPIGTRISGYQGGAGQVTVAITADTLVGVGTKTTAQYSRFLLEKIAATTWLISGDITT